MVQYFLGETNFKLIHNSMYAQDPILEDAILMMKTPDPNSSISSVKPVLVYCYHRVSVDIK